MRTVETALALALAAWALASSLVGCQVDAPRVREGVAEIVSAVKAGARDAGR